MAAQEPRDPDSLLAQAEHYLSESHREFMAGNLPPSHELRQKAKSLLKEAAGMLLDKRVKVQPQTGARVARRLKGLEEHGLARRILLRLREESPNSTSLAQQLALSTYKDE